MPEITAFYAALLGLFFFWLSLRVSMMRLRRASGVPVPEEVLTRAVRSQGNASEYIPIGLILLGLQEWAGSAPPFVHLFGLMLLGGRIGHFLGYGLGIGGLFLRQYSMVATYAMLCFSSLDLLYLLLRGV